MLEHLRVHRRANHQRCTRSERSETYHLLGEAERQPRYNCGSGRRDHEQFRLPSQRNMCLGEVVVRIPHVPIRAPAADSLECDRRDEFGSFGGHYRIENGPRLGEFTREINGLVHGDTAGYPKYDVAVRQVVHG